jgi:hypothetical protein
MEPQQAARYVNVVRAIRKFDSFEQAKRWAKENIARVYASNETGGKGSIGVSKSSIDKYFNESSVSKSENAEVHKAAVAVLPAIIRESVVGEVHPDYIKKDGVRRRENGVTPNTEIHRLYGAMLFEGKLYRVKTTVKYFTDSSASSKAHSYEAIKIELPDDTSNSSERNQDSLPVSPIPAAKLLKNIVKSYETGKYLC